MKNGICWKLKCNLLTLPFLSSGEGKCPEWFTYLKMIVFPAKALPNRRHCLRIEIFKFAKVSLVHVTPISWSIVSKQSEKMAIMLYQSRFIDLKFDNLIFFLDRCGRDMFVWRFFYYASHIYMILTMCSISQHHRTKNL